MCLLSGKSTAGKTSPCRRAGLLTPALYAGRLPLRRHYACPCAGRLPLRRHYACPAPEANAAYSLLYNIVRSISSTKSPLWHNYAIKSVNLCQKSLFTAKNTGNTCAKRRPKHIRRRLRNIRQKNACFFFRRVIYCLVSTGGPLSLRLLRHAVRSGSTNAFEGKE